MYRVFLLIFILCFPLYALESSRPWGYVKIGANRLETQDIMRYIEATRVPSEAKKILFQIAQKDWAIYKELLKNEHEKYFEKAVKEMAYYRLVEFQATRAFNSEKRQTFLITENDFFKKLQEIEERAVQKYLNQNLGIVKARNLYGNDLIESGYPHQKQETNEEVYWRWYEDQKDALREKLREQEVRRHEYFMASKLNPRLENPSFTATGDLKKELDQVIKEKLHNKRLNSQEVNKVLRENPEIQARIKKIHAISLMSTPLSEMKQLDPDDKFREAYRLIQRKFVNQLTPDLAKRIVSYFEIAFNFAEKYKEQETLIKMSKDSEDRFVQGGSYNDFMLSKLYTLATTVINRDKMVADHQLKEKLTLSLETTFNKLKGQVLDQSLYLQENNHSKHFESVVYSVFLEIWDEQGLKKEYKDFAEMAAWVVKFEAKKISLEDSVKIIVQKTDAYELAGHKALKKLVKQREFKKGLEKYQQQELINFSHLLEYSFERGHFYRGQRGLNEIIFE